MLSYPERRAGSTRWLAAMAGSYALATAAEVLDPQLFELTGGLVSGHTLKHLLASAGLWSLVALMRRGLAGGPG